MKSSNKKPIASQDIEKTILISRDEGIQAKEDTSIRAFQETLVMTNNKTNLSEEIEETNDSGSSNLEKSFFKKAISRKYGDDKYSFQNMIVSGGMGAIHNVLDQDLKRTTAMKVILSNYKNDPDSLKSFITEAKITGLLEHPNIIPVHDLGFSSESGLYFTMKLAHGEALNDVLKKIKEDRSSYLKRYNLYHLLGIFRKVCDALSFAHSKNIIHQDIKPHNIMVGKYGEVLLMDWGIAKYIGDPEQEKNAVYQEIFQEIQEYTQGAKGQIKGSPTFMSPEQTQGDPELLDKKTDIFLAGATLYHMMTLETPYVGNDVYEVLQNAENCQLIPPDQRAPFRQLPVEVCRIIMKAMAPAKKDRYENVDDLISDIDDILSGKWSQLETKKFTQGQFLMKEGEVGEEAYIIKKGEVQVSRKSDGNQVVLGVLKEGDIVGEMALIINEKRSASVQSAGDTEVEVLNKHLFEESLKKLSPAVEKIITTLTQRLSTANERINPHLTSDITYFVLQQLRLIISDKYGDNWQEACLPAKELVSEISENLGVTHQRVTDVLAKAVKLQLIVYKDQFISIPDMTELKQFTRFGKMITKMPK